MNNCDEILTALAQKYNVHISDLRFVYSVRILALAELNKLKSSGENKSAINQAISYLLKEDSKNESQT